MTDTDSPIYKITGQDPYLMMQEHAEEFYPKDHRMCSGKNAKVLGKFKDEIGGQVLKEFIGLRPKCYILLFWEEKKRKIGEKTGKRAMVHTVAMVVASKELINSIILATESVHKEILNSFLTMWRIFSMADVNVFNLHDIFQPLYGLLTVINCSFKIISFFS